MSPEQREKERARELRKSQWWQSLIQKASCYYCQKPLTPKEVTMDHIVPISRGGRSTKGNIVPACKACNTAKRDLVAVEWQAYLDGQLSQGLAEAKKDDEQES